MANKTVVNLAQPAIEQEISQVLATYPDHPHQQAFAAPEMRQQLLSFVLNSMPSQYVVVDAEASLPADAPADANASFSSEEVAHLDAVIHAGIQSLLQDKAEWVDRHIPQPQEPGQSASHWFG
jgi:hypothetical protein